MATVLGDTMGKRKNRKKRQTRENTSFPSRSRLRFVIKSMVAQTQKQNVEDKRRWDPAGRYATAKLIAGTPHHLTDERWRKVKQGPKVKSKTVRMGFALADKVLVCVRRRIRREVMHALKIPGRGGQRRARWNPWSKLRC